MVSFAPNINVSILDESEDESARPMSPHFELGIEEPVTSSGNRTVEHQQYLLVDEESKSKDSQDRGLLRETANWQTETPQASAIDVPLDEANYGVPAADDEIEKLQLEN